MVVWSERRLIEKIRRASYGITDGLITSIGDDCCEVMAPGSFLISTDSLIDSIHFDRSFHPPHLLGRKSMAVNLSDIAAMGGRPRFVLISLCLPEDLKWDWISEWLDGALEILKEFDCVLIGGDTVKAKELAFTVTVLGEPLHSGAIYRNSAKVGDTVWVSGPLGSAGCGLQLLRHEQKQPGFLEHSSWDLLLQAHLNPVPQIDLGKKLAQSGLVTAMQDISDGLSTDLAHICKASGVSAFIHADRLPFLPELPGAAAVLGMKVEDLTLRAGEDYQLVFTVQKDKEKEFLDCMEKGDAGPVRIGEIQAGKGVFLQRAVEIEEITFQGYEH